MKKFFIVLLFAICLAYLYEISPSRDFFNYVLLLILTGSALLRYMFS